MSPREFQCFGEGHEAKWQQSQNLKLPPSSHRPSWCVVKDDSPAQSSWENWGTPFQYPLPGMCFPPPYPPSLYLAPLPPKSLGWGLSLSPSEAPQAICVHSQRQNHHAPHPNSPGRRAAGSGLCPHFNAFVLAGSPPMLSHHSCRPLFKHHVFRARCPDLSFCILFSHLFYPFSLLNFPRSQLSPFRTLTNF